MTYHHWFFFRYYDFSDIISFVFYPICSLLWILKLFRNLSNRIYKKHQNVKFKEIEYKKPISKVLFLLYLTLFIFSMTYFLPFLVRIKPSIELFFICCSIFIFLYEANQNLFLIKLPQKSIALLNVNLYYSILLFAPSLYFLRFLMYSYNTIFFKFFYSIILWANLIFIFSILTILIILFYRLIEKKNDRFHLKLF